jgi:hypothetical protein
LGLFSKFLLNYLLSQSGYFIHELNDFLLKPHRICYYRVMNTQKRCLLIYFSFNFDLYGDAFLYWEAIVIYHEWRTRTRPPQQNHPRHIHHPHSLTPRLLPSQTAPLGLWYGRTCQVSSLSIPNQSMMQYPY